MIIVILLLIATLYLAFSGSEPPPPDDIVNGDDWNKNNPDGSLYLDSLYALGEIPPLEKLLVNTSFIKQVAVNRLPYLYGFSSDGNYSVFIYYKEKEANEATNGYLVQFYNTISSDLFYSIYIPDIEQILDSKELKLANEALTAYFAITTPATKLSYLSGMEYAVPSGSWIFTEDGEKSVIKIANSALESEWLIRTGFDLQKVTKDLDLFTVPGKEDLLTFVFYHQEHLEDGEFASFAPLFIQLDTLSKNNSLSGMVVEADLWLYGDFAFIYNQWEVGGRNGFMATSSEVATGELVEQWIYLDSDGKMKWYGNSQGIFDSEGKPLQSPERYFNYRVKVISANNGTMEYLVIDQFDQLSKQLLRTIEFQWQAEKYQLVLLQTI